MVLAKICKIHKNHEGFRFLKYPRGKKKRKKKHFLLKAHMEIGIVFLVWEFNDAEFCSVT